MIKNKKRTMLLNSGTKTLYVSDLDGTLLGSPFESLFGMDNFEFTAKCHGVPLSIVAQWRYQGWPDKCCVTNQRIDYRNDHWLAKEIANGEYGLMKL